MGSVLSSLKKADDKVVLITGCTEGGIGHALAVYVMGVASECHTVVSPTYIFCNESRLSRVPTLGESLHEHMHHVHSLHTQVPS